MIRILFLALAIFFATPTDAQIRACLTYESAIVEAKALWPELLGVFEGAAAQDVLLQMGINDPGATLVEIYFDPKDGDVILIGFANGCHRGHLNLPDRSLIDRFLKKS